jgi:S-adenosylmethionine-dependent methyltransferase
MTTADAFAKNLASFKEHQNTPWSRLRYAIALANLKRHLRGEGLAVLDAGGGNGLDAVALAAVGHSVVLLDYSAEMLEEARIHARNNGLLEAVAFRRGDVTAIPHLFPAASFDAVLCHNVLQYVEDLDSALQGLVHSLKPRGILSIICVNRYSEPYRLALQQQDLPAARAALGAKVIVSRVFDAPMKAYAAEDLRGPLEKAGCAVAGLYGIRCINDYLPGNERKYDPEFFAEMEKLESAMSGTYPYYLAARLFQIIAQKAAP